MPWIIKCPFRIKDKNLTRKNKTSSNTVCFWKKIDLDVRNFCILNLTKDYRTPFTTISPIYHNQIGENSGNCGNWRSMLIIDYLC